MNERDKKAFEQVFERIRNMSQKDVDELNEKIKSSLQSMEKEDGILWLTCEELDKLKKNAKRVNEKDGKIILDKNDPNDIDWWNEDE